MPCHIVQMLKKKVGVLSTRSPHRPNPIGRKEGRKEEREVGREEEWTGACGITPSLP